MKIVTVLSTLLTIASAGTRSKPFHLKIKSNDASINGKRLYACFALPGLDLFCIEPPGAAGINEYVLETTQDDDPVKEGYTKAGEIMWRIKGEFNTRKNSKKMLIGLDPGGPVMLSTAMSLHVEPYSNVALPTVKASAWEESTEVTFEKETQEMAIAAFSDDTKTPPEDGTYIHKNWYVCETNYFGNKAHTLSWVPGSGNTVIPQNPTCVKVQVIREFV